MAGNRTPGPMCQVEDPLEILDGTLCRAPTPLPGLICTERNSTIAYSGPLVLSLSGTGGLLGLSGPAIAVPLPELGSLSARYESNGNPGAIGYDTTGGWSYGAYQIATIPGTFDYFMTFLQTNYPALAKPLDDAGGSDDAYDGALKFRTAWVKLAQQDTLKFLHAQHEFIKNTHYDRQVAKLKQNLGIDVNQRSRALQNVVWSMAVQHGNGTQSIFANALKNSVVSSLTDMEIIALVYAERSKVDTYFASSTKAVKAAVKKRFEQEERDAIRMLQEELGAQSSSATVL